MRYIVWGLSTILSKQPEPALRLLAEAAKADPRRAEVQRLIAEITGELQANEDSAAAWDRYAPRSHPRTIQPDASADLPVPTCASSIPASPISNGRHCPRHPDDPIGYYELGLAQSMNDPTKGLSSLDKALQLKPDFVEARSAHGALYYLQGEARGRRSRSRSGSRGTAG